MAQQEHRRCLHCNPWLQLFRQDRTRRKGGGVGIYSRSSLISEVVETPYHAVGVQSGHETLCVKITKCSQLYMVVYHPPKPIYNSHDFVARLTNDVDYLISTYPHAVLILTGDFNRLDMSMFLPARRYASAGNRHSNVSVRLSVCHAPVLCQNEEN